MTQWSALSRRAQALLTILGLIAVLAFGRPALRWLWHRLVPPSRPMLPYGVLRVGIDASYPPFGVDPGDGQLIGLDVDLARAVADELGVEVQFVNMGYDGLYDSLKADQVDVLFSALRIDPLRTDDVRYSTPYFDAGLVLVHADETPFDTMRALDGHAVAVAFGGAGDLEARRWQRRLKRLDIQAHATSEEAIDAVLAGSADAALVDTVSARLWLREHQDAAHTLRIAPEGVTSDPYAAAVRWDNPRLQTAINRALDNLREHGRLEAIIARWL
ncbi:MAG: transporter substrate-binding domain-containing protein [Anaerolineae bacterium]